MTDRDQSERRDLEQFLALDDEGLMASLDAHFGEDGRGREASAFTEICRDAIAPELGQPTGSSGELVSRALRERRVAERVLARSTREDLRRRADLGLVVDFMAERLRQSALLRVAAALLLVQLTVVPLVALHLASESGDRGLQFRIEPAQEVFESLPERDEDYEVEGGLAAISDPLIADDLFGDVLASLATLEPVESVSAEGASLAALEAVLRGEISLGEAVGSSPVVAWADLEARLILWQEGGRFSGLARSIDAATAALADADTDGQALLSFALRRAASFHLAVAPLPPAPESLNLRDALQRCLEGLNDPVTARWRRALRR